MKVDPANATWGTLEALGGEAPGRGGGPRLKAGWRVWRVPEGVGGGDSGPGYCLRPPPPAFARPLVSQRKHASQARE